MRLSVLVGLLLACSHAGHGAARSQVTADDLLIVPGARVGQFEIGRDTPTSIFGADTPEVRKQFRDRGFVFTFDSQRELVGVMVFAPEYATSQGFRVGTLAHDIEAALGEPLRRVEHDTSGRKLSLPVLGYQGICFYLGTDAVMAIGVGRS